ncbi:Methionine biosynthesis protein [gamma proteobacterium HdN1]|nr:Methionine biosynthesis protein [gamma proteobacterium HdN1]
MRSELQLIQQWIHTGASVLDLGCGDGTLLAHLIATRNVLGYGLEINHDKIVECLNKGVNVIQQDLDQGLANIGNQSFDVVVMTQALQAVTYPEMVLDDMLRVGKECIVTFPNFGHWRNRLYLGLLGRMPMSRAIPYNWYDTPNIHLCTFRDFEAFCHKRDIRILHRTVVDMEYENGTAMRILPNLFGETAIYHIAR